MAYLCENDLILFPFSFIYKCKIVNLLSHSYHTTFTVIVIVPPLRTVIIINVQNRLKDRGADSLWQWNIICKRGSTESESIKGELQRESKLISYERAFNMLDNGYVYHSNRSSRSRVIIKL